MRGGLHLHAQDKEGAKMPRTTSVPKSQKALPYFNYNDVTNAWFTIDEMCFYCNLVEKVLLQLIEQLGYTSKLISRSGRTEMDRKHFLQFHHELYRLYKSNPKVKRLLDQYTLL